MWLIVEEDGDRRRVAIRGGAFYIGRDDACDLVLIDSQVSSRHAVIEQRPDGRLQLRDLASTNGTWVDGQRLADQPFELRDGERIRLGRATLTVDARPTERGSTEVARTVVGGQPPPPDGQDRRSESMVMRVSRAVTGSPSGVLRQLQRTARRAVWVAMLAVVVALAAIGAALAAALGAFSSPPPKPPASPPTPTDVARVAAPSTVYVLGLSSAAAGSVPIENGSGWVFNAAQGLIVTNDHVAEGAAAIQVGVGTAPGATVSPQRRSATIVGTDPCEDVALLRVTGMSGLKTLQLGSQASLSAGDPVVTLGFPGTAANAGAANATNAVLIIRSGNVSSPRTEFGPGASLEESNLPNVIQLPVYMVTPGNSGGPLVDENSDLVGMNTASDATTAAYAIGVDRIKALVPELEQGSIDTFGFVLDGGVITMAQQAGETWLPQGLAVDGAVNGSPAATLSIPETQPDTTHPFNPTNNPPPAVLTSVNGVRLSDSKASYCAAVQGLSRGQRVPIQLEVPAVTGNGRLVYRSVSARLPLQ